MAEDRVEIVEMGPRDGLQNEKRLIPAAEKIALVNALSAVGFDRIEVTSFVSPKWVPQMADAAEVLAGITRRAGVSYAALTPNLKGFERAMEAGADEVAIFGSASEGFSQANINCSISESLERFLPIMEAASVRNVKVRGYVSCVTDCPYDGPTPPEQVALVARELIGMGCYEVSLGDTIGKATPETIRAMLSAVLEHVPADQVAGHYHDTEGRALDNIEMSLELGLRVFDAAVGGLGGCPYAPGAAGNVATEAVHDRLLALGLQTGLDREALETAAEMARGLRG
ncbi:MAG TPA: hydroxymethylglutaryl-CoA lyase [Maritimibacter sp.]|nr:hydroxymethylglutaryl-CoA lyase [Maritimibacter sp.]